MRIIVETDLQDIIYIIYIVTFKKWMYSNLNVWHMIFLYSTILIKTNENSLRTLQVILYPLIWNQKLLKQMFHMHW